jgi:hypothetical protein
MNKNEIMNKMSRSFHKVGFTIKKHSPEILVGVGVVGVVTSAVLACKATTKVSAIMDKAKNDIADVHKVLEDPDLGQKYVEEYGEPYTVEESKKDLTIIYAHTGLDLVKLYAPSVILGVASLACILASNNILHKRNAALAAAYATVDGSFKDYRNRVIERFGEELDRELKYNIKSKEIEEIVKDEETGEEKVVKKTIQVANSKDLSEYARCFDETCAGWTRSSEHNLTFIKHVQNWANDKLRAEGILFLNDVYHELGFKKTQAGQVVGWVYKPDCEGYDSWVDFGIFDLYDEQKRNFVNGYEKSIWLDFNVDGDVWSLWK